MPQARNDKEAWAHAQPAFSRFQCERALLSVIVKFERD